MEFLILVFLGPLNPTFTFCPMDYLVSTNEKQGMNTHLISVNYTILNDWIQHHLICVFEFWVQELRGFTCLHIGIK